MESARERIFNYARSDAAVDRSADDEVDLDSAHGFGWQRLAAITAVAALVVVAVWIAVGWQARGDYARLDLPERKIITGIGPRAPRPLLLFLQSADFAR
jgi:hypothetical protein